MGNWNISIRGVGVHHNLGHDEDANRMAAEFVEKLRAAGHKVISASITVGSEEDISQPRRYLDDRDAIENVARKPRCGKPVEVKAPTRLTEPVCRLVENHEDDCEPTIHWERQ